ncbi:MAG: pentapeptide repeat-containing protein [Dolichospermum sp.]
MPPDYSGQNLQGRSFKGQNLTGANFSKADIRGANFTNAILKGVDFTGAKAGLQKRWVIGLLIITLLLSALSGFFSAIIGVYIAYIFFDDVITGIVSLVMVTVFFIVTIRKGLVAGAGAVALALAGSLVVALAEAGSLAVALALAGSLAGVVAGSLAGVVAGSLALAGVFVLFSAYIGWRSLKGDERDPWIRSYAIAFAATGGTSFYGADLTDADFTGAILKNTDFRTANLTRTRFYEAKKLDFARPGNTILSNPAVLNLLITLNGRNKSYIGANLRGANLIGADLKEANLKNADIIEATFQEANLEWANLTLTQAIGTNFTKAQMTGACVEAWNIESTTILDNVDCRFVYLLEDPKPRTDDRERRPSSGEFQPGEFTKLFEEVLNTVDLIFQNGIDWKAFITAFKKVQVENQDTELVIQSIENKGDGVVVVKVAVPENANKEKIHSDFTENYQLALAAVEEKYKAQLQAKDNEIVIYRQQSAEMTEIVKLLANKPINVQVDNRVENKNMTNSNDSSRNVEVEMNIQKVDGGVAGKVMGNQVITPKQNLADSASEIQQLLQILNQSYPADIPTDTQAEIEVAVKGINKNPQLKERVIGALKAGGIEAIKELADNIYVNVLIAAYDGWKNPQS